MVTDPVPKLFGASPATHDSGPVGYFGLTFESHEARRKYFLARFGRLKEKLPELRQRPDFPRAENEDRFVTAPGISWSFNRTNTKRKPSEVAGGCAD